MMSPTRGTRMGMGEEQVHEEVKETRNEKRNENRNPATAAGARWWWWVFLFLFLLPSCRFLGKLDAYRSEATNTK
jgi:hypothetical protein